MKKALIFDLDGTLLDTSLDIHCVLNQSLKKFGVPELTIDKTLQYVGNGAKKLVERALGDEYIYLFDVVYKDYGSAFSLCQNKLTRFYDGEEQFFEKLNKQNIKKAIVTNKPQTATENVYRKFLSRFNFDYILGQTDERSLKPNPYSVFYIIECLGLNTDDCVFIGDGETDIQTAKNAGIDCISVLWGYRDEKTLRDAGGVNFAKSYAQLAEMLKL